MKYKAIIFDMDGTIVDTQDIWTLATKEFIKRKNININLEELDNKLRGLALTGSCEIIKQIGNLKESVQDLVKEKIKIASSLYNNNIKFIDGFTQFHNKLEKYNLKSGVATNADDVFLKLTKKVLNLEKYFGEHIYNISHVNNLYKPNPAIYLHAAKQLNINPLECIAIEDSYHGIKAAKDAKMFCIGINTAKNKDALKESDIIIDNYTEICLDSLLKK